LTASAVSAVFAGLCAASPVPLAVIAIAAALPIVLTAVAGRAVDARRQSQRAASVPAELRALADAISVGVPLERAAGRVGRSGTRAARDLRAFAAAREGGATLDEALGVLVRDDTAGAWSEAAAAIALQRRCGGDLPASLRAVAGLLEELLDARRDARAAMSQARFTAYLVCSLPLLVGCGVELIAPGTWAQVAGTPASLMLAGLAVVVQLASIAVIARIASASGA